MLNNKIY